ncbi:MAG TPA: prolyl aminopeptidase [Caldilineaceae bacterium]|nr:prolyl aminopeptidase [Caldilineaceae bacterium]
MTNLAELYPAIDPFASGTLAVGDGHQLYWEMVGNPGGTPALYLHGGPGSGASARARRYFDPGAYRAVLFDQRGCGRSRPLASQPDANLRTNDTNRLIADIELLREHLGIERWVVTGVSWGVSLGLVYAQRHPTHVSALVLGAVTAGTWREIDWITRQMGRLFPREWAQFVALVPEAERGGNLAAAYARLLASSDPEVREQAARAWCQWEDTHVSLMPGWQPDSRYDDPEFRMIFARLVTHYWGHNCFLPDNAILAGMTRLADIPGILIHGRWDVSGPMDIAWTLHRAWRKSELQILDDAGHGGMGFSEAMTAALDRFRAV